MDCIFCSIVEGKIPSQKVYEDDNVVAFKDINPEAPVHIIIIPKMHISSIMEINKSNSNVIEYIFLAIQKIAEETGISETGFRVVTNYGVDGGQTVNHIHFHLLGGRSLQWPPG